MFQRIDVDLIFRLGDGRSHQFGPDFQPVGAARQHGLFGHPDQGGLELVGHFGRIARGDNVAARAVYLVFQCQGDGLSGHSQIKVAIIGDNPRHLALLARRQDPNRVAGADHAAGDLAGKASEIEIGPIDPLDGQAQVALLAAGLVQRHGLQMIDQHRAVEPGGSVAA